MIRYINIANDKNRDAEVTFKSFNPKPLISLALPSGEEIDNKRIIKSTSQTSTSSILSKYNEQPKKGVDFQLQLARFRKSI